MDMFDMSEGFGSLQESVSRVQCPVMVLGAQTDILIPIWQQREMVKLLRASGMNLDRSVSSRWPFHLNCSTDRLQAAPHRDRFLP